MEILQIVRSEPDAATEKMMLDLSKESCGSILKLYEPDIEWEEVIDAIFNHKQVVCWW